MQNTETTHHPQPNLGPAPALTGTDPRPALARVAEEAERLIGAVRDDQLDLPTPCEALDVRTLVGHLLYVAERIEEIGRDGQISEAGYEGDFAPIGTLEGAAATFATTMERAKAAWAQRDLHAPLELPWRPATGQEAAEIYVNELIVHTWDLSRAIGVPAQWGDEDVAIAEARMRHDLPDADRTAFFAEILAGTGMDAPFGEIAPIPDGASAADRLAAVNGRALG